MSSPPWDDLDPGIRETVRLLRDAGFETTDSGDGVSKTDMGCAMPFPHVAAVVDAGSLVTEADRMACVLGDGWTVEASYSPNDGVAVLFASKAVRDE